MSRGLASMLDKVLIKNLLFAKFANKSAAASHTGTGTHSRSDCENQ